MKKMFYPKKFRLFRESILKKMKLAFFLLIITSFNNFAFGNNSQTYHVNHDIENQNINNEVTMFAEQQTVTVSGLVIDTDGVPIPGVNIVIRGTTIGTVTDLNGNYTLANVPTNASLVFSFVGMIPEEIFVGGQTVINIEMRMETIGIDEVVAIGYGVQRRVDLTGSVASVRSEEIRMIPVERWDQAIQGRAAGVMLRNSNFKPGGGQTIRIRGFNSISGSNEPLYVIDGIIGANINSLNANDIESIDILKDAAAASIYGSRGANGVVIVTTRSGVIGKPTARFDVFYGISQPSNVVEMMNAREYMEFVNEVRAQQGAVVAYPDIQGVVNQIGDGTIWSDELYGMGVQQQYNLSLDGGTESVNYTASVGYRHNDGIISGVDFSRFNTRFNVAANVTNRIKLNGAFNYSSTTLNDFFDTSWAKAEPLMAALRFRPTQTAYDENGNLIPGFIPNPYEQGAYRINTNVLYNQEKEIRETIAHYLQFNFQGELRLTDFLRYNAQVALEPTMSNYRYFRPSDVVFDTDWSPQQFAFAQKNHNMNYQWLTENFLSFDQSFGHHSVTLIAGGSAQLFSAESTSANSRDFPFDVYEFHNLGAGASATRGVGSGFSQEQLLSAFSRLNYNFNGKYFLQVNARYDGSSKFAPQNRWAFFPSAAIGWRFSEETFIRDLNIFSNGKIRVSHGSIGSHGIGRYATKQRIGGESYGYGFHQTPVAVRQPIGIANTDLKWETTTQTDVGLDLGFFNNRMNIVLDYYYKLTTDLLLRRNISLVNYPHRAHEPAILSNIGALTNKGFEFSVDYLLHASQDFRWSLAFNGTFQNTILTDLALPEGTPYLLYGDNLRRNYQILEEGQPFGNYVGYKTDGLYQTQAEIDASAQPTARPGDLKYVDSNGDGVITGDDFDVLGNAIPDFFGGLSSSFSYKNFDLSFYLVTMIGHSIFNYDSYTWRYGLSSVEWNKEKAVATERWTGPGTSNHIPRAGYHPINITDGPNGALDVMVEDASFLRLQHLTLSYNLPQSVLTRIGITNARVFVQGQNLFTLTGYSGVDPEIDQMSGSTSLLPMNTAYYPAVKTYTIGLNFGF